MKDKIITAILEGSPYQNRIVTAVNAPKEEVVAELNQMVIDGTLSASPDPIRGVRYSVLSQGTPEKGTEESESPDDDGTFDSDVFGFMGKLTKASDHLPKVIHSGTIGLPDLPAEDIMSDSDVDRYNDLLKTGYSIGADPFTDDPNGANTVAFLRKANVQIGEDSLTDGAITEVFGTPVKQDPSDFYRHISEGVKIREESTAESIPFIGVGESVYDHPRPDGHIFDVHAPAAKPVVQKKKKK